MLDSKSLFQSEPQNSVILRLENMKILLAEDWPDNQILIAHILNFNGAKVDVVSNGEEAMQMAQSNRYDLILMDMQMPVMDGYNATKHLRNDGYKVPIVAITAHVTFAERVNCIAAGCVDYLSKPIRSNILIDLVAGYAPKK